MQNTGLGFFPGFETILGETLDWLGGGQGGNGGYAGWVDRYSLPETGGGAPCPGAPDAATVLAGLDRVDPRVVDALVGALAAANDGYAPSRRELRNRATLPLWVKAAMGGGDCSATSEAGRAANEALARIVAAGSGGAPTFPTSTPTPPPSPSFWDRLTADAQQAIQQILGAASADLARRIWNELPAAQRAQIEAEIARDRTAQVVGAGKTVLPILGGALLLLLLARRR